MIDHDRLLKTFMDLLRLPCPSYEEERVAEFAAGRLQAFGAGVRRDDIGNLVGLLDGEGEPILLNAHMDTVEPCQGVNVIRQGSIIRSDGNTVLGADDRAGIAVILEALESLSQSGTPHLPVEVVLTVREEVHLQGAKALDYSALQSKRGVALDSTGPAGSIVVAAPAHDDISATIIGRSAHAGVAPETGVNAIVIAADAIANMPLGRIDFETTANVGVICGGRATNIVPDRVEVKGEARSRNESKLAEQTSVMVSLLESAAKKRDGTCSVQVERVYPSYSLSDDNRLVRFVCSTFRGLGIECHTGPTGGGSDVNIFNALGIEAVNVSVGYRNPHSTTEEIDFNEMVKTAEFVVALLSR